MNTLDFVQVEDDARFTAYCGGLAADLKVRLHNHEGITAKEQAWLSQFASDPDDACQKLIDAYAVLQVSERLAKHTPPM